MNKANTIFIDIGNSLLKAKIENKYYSCYHHEFIDLFEQISSEYKMKNAVISSVNEPVYEKVIEQLNIKNITHYNAKKLFEQQTLIDFSKSEGVGNDRKLGLLGALQILTPPIITIDCGTATTFNVLNNKNMYCGGAIFPGIITQAKALNEYTDRLPFVQPQITQTWLGMDTTAAINSGIMATTIGGILMLLNETKNAIDFSDGTIIVTGGHSEMVYDTLKHYVTEHIYYKKYLVINGLEYLFNSTHK
jgi:type III pantothenate kinase